MAQKEQTILGAIFIILAIIIYVKTFSISYGLILAILGLALIIYRKSEDKIEKRRDKK